MLAWMGGKRRLVKNKKAQRKLEPIFNKTVTGVTQKTASRSVGAAAVDALSRKFRGMRPAKPAQIALEQPYKPKTRSAGGTSLDILAILPSSRVTTVFQPPSPPALTSSLAEDIHPKALCDTPPPPGPSESLLAAPSKNAPRVTRSQARKAALAAEDPYITPPALFSKISYMSEQ